MKINFIIFLLLLISCADSNKQTTKDIISKEKFTAILKDIHLAEASCEINKSKGIKNAEEILSVEYSKIYSSYNVVESEFQKTLEYFADKTYELEEIYSRILHDLIKEKTTLNP